MIDYHEQIKNKYNGIADYHEKQWYDWLSWSNTIVLLIIMKKQWYDWLSWRNNGMIYYHENK